MEDRMNIQAEQRQDHLETLRSNMDMKAEKMVLERGTQTDRTDRGLEEQLEDERKVTGNALERHEKEGRLKRELSQLKRAHKRKLRLLALSKKMEALFKLSTTKLAEKEDVAEQEKLEKFKIQEIIESEKRCMEEKADMNVSFIHADKLKYREESLEQIKEGNQNQRDTQRDRILENALLEQTLRKIRDEDEIEEAARLERVSHVKRETEGFQRQREIQKQSEKLSTEAAEAKIKAYADEKGKQKVTVKNSKDKEREESKFAEFTSKLIHGEEWEDPLYILAVQMVDEKSWQDIQKYKDRALMEEKIRIYYYYSCRKDIELKVLASKLNFKEQEEYRNQLLANLALQEQLEISAAGMKDLKKKELHASLLNQMKDIHRRQTSALLDEQREEEDRLRRMFNYFDPQTLYDFELFEKVVIAALSSPKG